MQEKRREVDLKKNSERQSNEDDLRSLFSPLSSSFPCPSHLLSLVIPCYKLSLYKPIYLNLLVPDVQAPYLRVWRRRSAVVVYSAALFSF